MTDLEFELMIANETIREAEEAFDQLRKNYPALREHADTLESLLKNHSIPFQAFGGW